MANSNISTVASNLSPAQIYGDAGLIYIIYKAQIVPKSKGQKNICGSLPRLSTIMEQETYAADSGKCFFFC